MMSQETIEAKRVECDKLDTKIEEARQSGDQESYLKYSRELLEQYLR